jgi:hypothetical protein
MKIFKIETDIYTTQNTPIGNFINHDITQHCKGTLEEANQIKETYDRHAAFSTIEHCEKHSHCYKISARIQFPIPVKYSETLCIKNITRDSDSESVFSSEGEPNE